MSAAFDMLEVEAQLEAAAVAGHPTQPVDNSSEAGLQSAAASSNGVAADSFYSSGKGGTWKKFKSMVKHKKEGSGEVRTAVQPAQHPLLVPGTTAEHQNDLHLTTTVWLFGYCWFVHANICTY